MVRIFSVAYLDSALTGSNTLLCAQLRCVLPPLLFHRLMGRRRDGCCTIYPLGVADTLLVQTYGSEPALRTEIFALSPASRDELKRVRLYRRARRSSVCRQFCSTKVLQMTLSGPVKYSAFTLGDIAC